MAVDVPEISFGNMALKSRRPRRNTTGVFVWLVKDWTNGLAPRPASWPEKPPSITLNPKRATKATLGGLKRIVAIGQHSIGRVVVGLLGGGFVGWVGNTIGEVSPDPVFQNVGEPAKKRAKLPPKTSPVSSPVLV